MKKNRINFAIACFTLFLSSHVFADGFNTEKKVFPNGLTVIVTEMPNSPMTSVFALVKTGSATEYQFLGSGLSHFLEHMLFKGTKKRSPSEIPALIQSVGGKINASTGHDHTIYTVTVPTNEFDIGLDIVSDMIMNATFDPVELEKEREVVINEMRLHRDNPGRRLAELSFENIYLRHPYRHPIIGYESLFKNVKRENFIEYYKMFYTPNNTIVSIAGNVKSSDVFKEVGNIFSDFERGIDIPRNLAQEPEQITSRYREENYATAVTHFSMSFSGVSLLDSDLFALDVLAQVLGQGRSSRLYQKLYEKEKLVYSVGASNFTPVDRGAFEIEGTLDYEKLETVVEKIKSEIKQIQEKGIANSELEKVVHQVVANHIYYRQTSDDIAYSQAFDEAFTGDYRFSEKYIEHVKELTPEDLKTVANKYLKDASLTTVVLTSEKAEESKEAGQARLPADFEKIVLENGLTILLRDDKSFPIVSVRLMQNGGLLEEPDGLYGISNIMASTWIKGSKKYSSERIAELTESKAINFSSYSGSNSIGIIMDFLKEDLNFAFSILSDVIFTPKFSLVEIEKVKENMLKAIERRTDNISSFGSFLFRNAMFEGHPYGRDSLGTPETLAAISQDDIVKFYEHLMVPKNVVFVVSGDIDKDKVLSDIKAMFRKFKNDKIAYAEHGAHPLNKVVRTEEFLKKDQAMVMMGFRAVSIDSADRYGLTVLATLLGSPFNGRLFNKIREEEASAYTVGGGLTPGIETGYLSFYALTSKDKTVLVEGWMIDEMKKLCQQMVTDEELKDTTAYLKGRFLESIQKGSDLAFQSGLDELYGLGYAHYKDYERLIDSISPEDIQRLANQYFTFDKMVTAVINPLKKESHEN